MRGSPGKLSSEAPGHEGPKATAVLRMAIAMGGTPVTFDNFDSPQGHEDPKATAVTRLATPKDRIPVIADNFLHTTRTRGSKSDDSHEAGDPQGWHPFDC